MPFITKLDFSDNRQVKQNIETNTVLSGGTTFGTPFSMLPTGPDLSTTAVTSTSNGLVSTFSGNSATTVYSWYTPIMGLANAVLSAWTPSNSATTQNTGFLFSASTSATTVDGNIVNLTYTGASFDVSPIAMVDLGSGNYSGTVNTVTFQTLSAGTLDYTGRTIWVDVSGITRTEELIVTKNPVIGYVMTCVDAEGRLALQPFSGSSGSTLYWSAGTALNAIVMTNGGNSAIAQYSVSEGFNSFAKGDYSRAQNYTTETSGIASHAEGWATTANGDYSHAEGRLTKTIGVAAHAEGRSTTASGDTSHAEGNATLARGDSSHAEGDATTAIGVGSHSEGVGTKAIGDYSHAGGDASTSSGQTSFVHGQNSVAVGSSTIVLGSSITGTSNNTTYVDALNIKTVGAGPGVTDIGVDANGNVVNQASDLRLKQNISTLENALDKIRALRGVKYQWKDTVNGGTDYRIGFIAQEVNQVEPLLTFTDTKSEQQYMGVQYKDVTALLVEAVKELSSGTTINNNVYLETQSIIAEDNNIDLNYGGNQQTAVNGGIRVINALGADVNAEFLINQNGDWVTNNNLIPNGLIIPNYTPETSSDTSGMIGSITMDDNYIYVKTSVGWKRSGLENF